MRSKIITFEEAIEWFKGKITDELKQWLIEEHTRKVTDKLRKEGYIIRKRKE